MIERAVIVGKNNRLFFDLPAISSERKDESTNSSINNPDQEMPYNETECLEHDRTNINLALNLANGKVSGPDGAAALLGIKPTTLASRMKTTGIEK